VIIGLTGGIACGKSTVAALLEASGFLRSDSDAIVRQLLAEDASVIEAIAARFGSSVLRAEGGIDRSQLATIVFQDADALHWLEATLHPVVGEIWKNALKEQPDRDWVVEIPLLFEKNLEKYFGLTVTVSSSQECQIQRLALKGIPRGMALARMQRQMPLEDKVARADLVIDNNGSLGFLERQTTALMTPAALTASHPI